MTVTLYTSLSAPVRGVGVGRTEETKTIETIDKDRQALDGLTALLPSAMTVLRSAKAER